MGLGNRHARRHDTIASRTAAGFTPAEHDPSWDFQPGQRVMTCDGYPGVVASVEEGLLGRADQFLVNLDGDMGHGYYSSGQLSDTVDKHANLGSAVESYPELGTILVDRPDPAKVKVYASLTKHAWEQGDEAGEHYDVSGYCPHCGTDIPGSPHDEQPLFEHAYVEHGVEPEDYEDWARHGAHHTGAYYTADEVREEGRKYLAEQGAHDFGEPDVDEHGHLSWGGHSPACGDHPDDQYSMMGQNDATEHTAAAEGNPCYAQQGAVHPAGQQCECFRGGPAPMPPTPQRYKFSSVSPWSLLHTAAADPDFGFEVTASWSDVRAKAKRIRSEGRITVTSATSGLIFAEVQGDHHVYETGLQRLPGRQAVHQWSCGCKWGAYHWGADDDMSRFAGRMCSHALALQYEAQSRGMFGREIVADDTKPTWAPRKVVVKYDIDDGRNISAPATPGRMPVAASRRSDICANCGQDIHDAGGIDPNVPWVHAQTGNSFCDVDGPSDATLLAGSPLDRPEAHPVMHHSALQVAASLLRQAGESRDELLLALAAMGLHGRSVTASVNNAWGDPSQPEPRYLPGPTKPGNPNDNPASMGWATQADPDSWNQHGDSIGVYGELQAQADWNPLTYGTGDVANTGQQQQQKTDQSANQHLPRNPLPEAGGAGEAAGAGGAAAGEGAAAAGAGEAAAGAAAAGEGAAAAGGMSELLPLLLLASAEESDDSIFEPQEEGATATLHDEPEPALPSTDGSLADVVAAFQATAAAQSLNGSGGSDGGEMAEMVRATMAKEGMKEFTPAERQMIINEGSNLRARNTDKMDITGTHYEDQEKAAALLGGTDDWLA